VLVRLDLVLVRKEKVMKPLSLVPMVASMLVAAALIAGCATASTTPTQAPAAAPKAGEPTKAAASAPAQPTAAASSAQATSVPAKKVDFPTKGKPISVIVPFAAGAGNDLVARVATPLMEKDLGTPVQVVDKPGAGAQTGIQELALAKPDGYTIGYTPFPAIQALYFTPERKAAFDRTSFAPIGLHAVDVGVIAVKADSPYKNMKDLVDAAKAKPNTIKVSTSGVLSSSHLILLQIAKAAGANFTVVHFDSANVGVTNLLGGHIDAVSGFFTDFASSLKSGQVRLLGIMDQQESKFAPGVPTMEAQGYKLYASTMRVLSAPAGTPKEIVDVLSASLKKAVESDEHKQRADELGMALRYMGPDDLAKLWADTDAQMKPVIEQALVDAAKQ
jgi:tripartite-type tricarboxylate transporter receptor subunit TctC